MCAVCQRSSSYSGGVPPSDGLCVFSAHLPYFVHLLMYLLALRVSRCFMWACVCVRTNLCMSVFESLLVPSGSSRVPDPISCRCWQRDIQARGSREPDTAWRSFLSLLRTTTWFVIVLMALCACVAFLAFIKLWFCLSGPRGQDMTVRERLRHGEGRPVIAVVMRSARTLLLVRENSWTPFENMLVLYRFLVRPANI